MDKKVILFLIILINQFCFSQSKTLSKVDNLETELEVQSFIRSCSKSKEDYLSEFELKSIQSFDKNYNDITEKVKKAADSLGINKSFYKGDFDHNGETDLIFIGDNKSCFGYNSELKQSYPCNSSVKILLNLAGKYEIKNIQPTHFDFVIPIITKINDKDYLKVVFEETNEVNDPDKYYFTHKIISKILDYQFNNFIEYNDSPSNFSIQKIEFETGLCYGTCPMFNLELNKNGKSRFIAKAYNFFDRNDPKAGKKAQENFKNGEGNFETILKESDFQNIEALLNYINFPELKDDYAVRWTDDQSVTLTVTYDNGKIKKIKDYGLSGTYGLKNLYKICSSQGSGRSGLSLVRMSSCTAASA